MDETTDGDQRRHHRESHIASIGNTATTAGAAASANAFFDLFVRIGQKLTQHLRVESSEWTLRDVKLAVRAMGAPLAAMGYFTYAGTKLLDDNSTLRACHVGRDATLHLPSLRLRNSQRDCRDLQLSAFTDDESSSWSPSSRISDIVRDGILFH